MSLVGRVGLRAKMSEDFRGVIKITGNFVATGTGGLFYKCEKIFKMTTYFIFSESASCIISHIPT